MIDLKHLTLDHPLIANLARRGFKLDAPALMDLQQRMKEHQQRLEMLQAKANAHQNTPEDKALERQTKAAFKALERQWQEQTAQIPNLLHPTVPEGRHADDNPVREEVHFPAMGGVRDYCDVGKTLGLDLDAGALLAGARFNVMKGAVARVHRKLIQHALDFYAAKGYEEHYLPLLVHQDTMFGTGQYPKFKEELFVTHKNTEEPLYLIPTGEVPLTNLMRDQIHANPNRQMMAQTPCFRKEAGAHGKDTRGIIRQHQFEKVELVRTCRPEEGEHMLETLVQDVKAFFNTLHMRFRIIELCAGDIGFAGHKAYDFEIWFEHQRCWREVASITWCHDFQARRMNARCKTQGGKKEWIHTLNGTGLAAGRVLAALLENRHADGVWHLPDCIAL